MYKCVVAALLFTSSVAQDIPPNPGFAQCYVCGANMVITIPDGVVSPPGLSETTCEQIQLVGLIGYIEPQLCPLFAELGFLVNCGCAEGTIPPSASPAVTTTLAPILLSTAPVPTTTITRAPVVSTTAPVPTTTSTLAPVANTSAPVSATSTVPVDTTNAPVPATTTAPATPSSSPVTTSSSPVTTVTSAPMVSTSAPMVVVTNKPSVCLSKAPVNQGITTFAPVVTVSPAPVGNTLAPVSGGMMMGEMGMMGEKVGMGMGGMGGMGIRDGKDGMGMMRKEGKGGKSSKSKGMGNTDTKSEDRKNDIGMFGDQGEGVYTTSSYMLTKLEFGPKRGRGTQGQLS